MAEIVGWRIVKAKRAKTAFSGEGARVYEGRWNSAGAAMVYCSEHLSLAALEILVHIQPIPIRDRFCAFRVSWDKAIMDAIDPKKLPQGWDQQPPGLASKGVGDAWIKSDRSGVLAVPSVLVPQERTFLLNPNHRDFLKIKIRNIGNFVLDRRLKR